MEFTEKRKMYQAEYHLLMQPYRRKDSAIIIDFHSAIEETLIGNFKSDLCTFLRETLKNNSITITGNLIAEQEGKKIIYTPREKFDFLTEKNPALKELRDRLGLDTDF